MKFKEQYHSNTEAQTMLNLIKDYSPFNEYFIGEYFSKIGSNGTFVVIYNLSKRDDGVDELDFSVDGDIRISKINGKLFVRRRSGQISDEVPIDYSLKGL